MKFRTDFVTNSSSSSFIVYFDEIPQSAEEMQNMLFGPRDFFPHPFQDINYEAEDIAKIVFNDMKDTVITKATKDEIIALLTNIFYWEVSENYPYPECPNSSYNPKDAEWKEYDKLERKVLAQRDKEALRLATAEFKKQFKGKPLDKVRIFIYGDHNGELECAMEHGDLFRRLFHIRISHH